MYQRNKEQVAVTRIITPLEKRNRRKPRRIGLNDCDDLRAGLDGCLGSIAEVDGTSETVARVAGIGGEADGTIRST